MINILRMYRWIGSMILVGVFICLFNPVAAQSSENDTNPMNDSSPTNETKPENFTANVDEQKDSESKVETEVKIEPKDEAEKKINEGELTQDKDQKQNETKKDIDEVKQNEDTTQNTENQQRAIDNMGPTANTEMEEEQKINEEKEAEKDSAEFFDEWGAHMANFTSTHLFTFEIPAGGIVRFYENIAKIPQSLRGMYSVSTKKNNKIKFTIIAPNGEIIDTKERKKEVIFYPVLKTPGKYVIEFTNENVHFY